MKNKERTKRKTLERCLVYLTGLLRMDSKNGAGFEPADERCVETFEILQKDCENVRELIRALESEPVRKTIANWETLVAAHKEDAMKF